LHALRHEAHQRRCTFRNERRWNRGTFPAATIHNAATQQDTSKVCRSSIERRNIFSSKFATLFLYTSGAVSRFRAHFHRFHVFALTVYKMHPSIDSFNGLCDGDRQAERTRFGMLPLLRPTPCSPQVPTRHTSTLACLASRQHLLERYCKFMYTVMCARAKVLMSITYTHMTKHEGTQADSTQAYSYNVVKTLHTTVQMDNTRKSLTDPPKFL
jgi:hypothetical protein